MNYNLKQIYNPELPGYLNDFLNYLGTIKGKSKNTLEGYKVDLTMFLKFLKLYKGLEKEGSQFENIKIKDIDIDIIRHVTLSDLFAFISFIENYRHNKS